MIKIGENMEEKSLLKRGIHKMMIVFFIITLILILLLLYSRYISTKKLEVKEYRILNEKFIDQLHGYKIAHISDIHYGKTTNKEDLEKIVDKINLTKPNILIFTGDLIDKDTTFTDQMKEEIEICLSKLNPSILKYAIKGEDDVKIDNYGLIMENSGFISLDNKYDTLYLNQTDYILLAGISTQKENNSVDSYLEKVDKYFQDNKENKPIYSILMMHEPDMIERANISNFDLALAGHSHGGQVKLPFIGSIRYPKYAQKYHEDYQKIDGVDFYITSGIGTTTYAFRFLNAPSFNLYRIVNY